GATPDFFDIVLLAVHGYGFGALKLLRPLYERVVTAMYLMAHPAEVKDFSDFADVHAHRVIAHAGDKVDVRLWVSPEWRADIEATYQQVKARFTGKLSWTRKDLKTLARDVGLDHLYVGAYLWPTLQLHTTRAGMEARLHVSEGNI